MTQEYKDGDARTTSFSVQGSSRQTARGRDEDTCVTGDKMSVVHSIWTLVQNVGIHLSPNNHRLASYPFNGSVAKGGGEGRLPSSGKKHKKRRRKSEAGVVLKVYVENFMCHRKLTVPLCK